MEITLEGGETFQIGFLPAQSDLTAFYLKPPFKGTGRLDFEEPPIPPLQHPQCAELVACPERWKNSLAFRFRVASLARPVSLDESGRCGNDQDISDQPKFSDSRKEH